METDDFMIFDQSPRGLGMGLFAKMGCVIYPVDSSQVDSNLSSLFNGFCLILKMPIGSIENSASREGLSYGRLEPTVPAINAALARVEKEVMKPYQERMTKLTTLVDKLKLISEVDELFPSISRQMVLDFYDSLSKEQRMFWIDRPSWKATGGHAVETRSYPARCGRVSIADSQINGRLYPTNSSRTAVLYHVNWRRHLVVVIRDVRPGAQPIKYINDRLKQLVHRECKKLIEDESKQHIGTVDLIVLDYNHNDFSFIYAFMEALDGADIHYAEDLPYDAPVKNTASPAVNRDPEISVASHNKNEFAHSLMGRFERVDRAKFFENNPTGVYVEIERGQFWSFEDSSPYAASMSVKQVVEILRFMPAMPSAFFYVPKSGSAAFKKHPGWKSIQEVMDEMVTLNPERQQDMIEYQLTAIEEKCKRIKEIMSKENVKLDPWMIDKVSIAFHNIDTIANKFMFGDKAD